MIMEVVAVGVVIAKTLAEETRVVIIAVVAETVVVTGTTIEISKKDIKGS